MKFREYLSEKSQGTYVCARFSAESNKAIAKFAKSIGLNPMPEAEFHATIAYSEPNLGVDIGISTLKGTAEVTGIKYLGDVGSEYRAVVIEIKSKEIQERHEYYIEEHGYKHTFNSFIQHVSLQYNPKEGLNLKNIKLPIFKIDLASEEVQSLKV